MGWLGGHFLSMRFAKFFMLLAIDHATFDFEAETHLSQNAIVAVVG